jgi:hypothetical protein
MSWWLNVFFLINGLWVPGSELHGWAPREYPSEAVCMERRAFAERECRAYPLAHESRWFCSEGEPLRTMPAEIGERAC